MITFPNTSPAVLRLARSAVPGALLVLAAGACREPAADAYGNFEATEVTVSAETSGRLLFLGADEGARLAAGDVLAMVDTSALVIQRIELLARRSALAARSREVDANIAALATQHDIAERERGRTERLMAEQAATAQQRDRAERDVRVLTDQLTGARAARTVVAREGAALDAQVDLLDDRLRRSRISSPLTGVVLTRYAEAGEFVQPGTPLLKLAALDTLTLRAYVSQAQLATLALGQPVQVQVDAGNGTLRALDGRITWIAATAEFTPTPVQTREERTTQVYAVKVAVPNTDGRLRVGMPGELVLATPASGGER